jgi:hypothetical protein
MGNNHAYPFIFAGTVSATGSAQPTTIASGVKFHGMPLADYSFVTVGGTVPSVVTKDSAANTITITPTASGTVDYIVMVGLNDWSIEDLACRGNTGARQMLP